MTDTRPSPVASETDPRAVASETDPRAAASETDPRVAVPPSAPTVSGAWLEAHLDRRDVVVLDVTVILDPESWLANTGRTTYEAAHVPGAHFVDLIEELSDPAGDEGLPEGVRGYRLPDPARIAEVLQGYGVDDQTTVVAYDTSAGMWAARLWWMLRVIGHDRVRVLDGGWAQWVAEGRPATREVPVVVEAAAPITVRLRPELLATTKDVESILEAGDRDAVLVNALWPEQFRGEAATPLPRAGRIPTSVNVPFTSTLDDDGRLQDPQRLAEVFAAAGVDGTCPVVTYCGGGIAASSAALALASIGIEAALYDGSLAEWVQDPQRPLETG